MVGSSDRSPCLCTQEKDYTQVYTGLDKHNFSAYICNYFLISHLKHKFLLLIEKVLLSTHNICFG